MSAVLQGIRYSAHSVVAVETAKEWGERVEKEGQVERHVDGSLRLGSLSAGLGAVPGTLSAEVEAGQRIQAAGSLVVGEIR